MTPRHNDRDRRRGCRRKTEGVATGVRRGFHSQYRTDIVHEIAMARRLHEAAVMRWGIIKLSRVLRTDPAAAMAKMAHCRVQTDAIGSRLRPDQPAGRPWIPLSAEDASDRMPAYPATTASMAAAARPETAARQRCREAMEKMRRAAAMAG